MPGRSRELLLLQNCFLCKSRVSYHTSFVTGVGHVDQTVAGLNGRWITEVAVPLGEVASVRKSFAVVRRKRGGERRTIIEAVVENEKQVTVGGTRFL